MIKRSIGNILLVDRDLEFQDDEIGVEGWII